MFFKIMIFGSVILPGRLRSHEDIICGFGYEPHGVAHAMVYTTKFSHVEGHRSVWPAKHAVYAS